MGSPQGKGGSERMTPRATDKPSGNQLLLTTVIGPGTTLEHGKATM